MLKNGIKWLVLISFEYIHTYVSDNVITFHQLSCTILNCPILFYLLITYSTPFHSFISHYFIIRNCMMIWEIVFNSVYSYTHMQVHKHTHSLFLSPTHIQTHTHHTFLSPSICNTNNKAILLITSSHFPSRKLTLEQGTFVRTYVTYGSTVL